MTVTRLLARPLLAATFVTGGVNALKNTEVMAQRAKPVIDRVLPRIRSSAPDLPVPEDPKTLVRINAGVQILAGLSLATGRAPRLSATALALSLVPTTAAGHRFWDETDPTAKNMQRTQFLKNVSVLGGLLLAAVDTEGRPGLAWRARHATGQVRREARHLSKSARREAKLAAKSLGS